MATRRTAVAEARRAYLIACSWRRRVERELRELGLTFTQWLVLDAIDAMTRREPGDGDGAVSQNQIARYTELDRGTISLVMKTLSDGASFVDREPEFGGPAYRVILTQRALGILQLAATRLEAVTLDNESGGSRRRAR